MTENNKWTKDKERLVLYADFMGFKSRVYNSQHADLKQLMIEFREKWVATMSPLLKDEHLQFAQFSDSIVIVADGISAKMVNLISKAAIRLMHVAMEMKLPIKGAIAQGMFSCDKSAELYLGRPLVDAYLLQEELKFYGIVVHHTAEKSIENNKGSNPYLNSKIYIEKGCVCHYHLCWNMMNLLLSKEDITSKCKDWLSNISKTVSGSPRMYIDRTLDVLERDSAEFKPKTE